MKFAALCRSQLTSYALDGHSGDLFSHTASPHSCRTRSSSPKPSAACRRRTSRRATRRAPAGVDVTAAQTLVEDTWVSCIMCGAPHLAEGPDVV